MQARAARRRRSSPMRGEEYSLAMSMARPPITGLIAIALVVVTYGVLAQPRGPGSSVPKDASGECPPGTTETRPGRCQKPEYPPPSILDYRPRSTLVTVQHAVPKAKFPVVDIHSHTGPSPETLERLVGELDALNVRVLVNLSGGGSADAVGQKVDFIRSTRYADRFRVFANVDWQGAGGPGWAENAVAGLEAAVKRGAIGLKVFKNLGLTAKKADGSRLAVDDPALAPVWQACARLNIPVLIHTAEPMEFFSPMDYKNERWLELALFPSRRNNAPGQPTFDQLLAERDRMFAANPKTRYIAAHFGYYGHDLARAAAALDRMPNVVLEVSAVLYEFGRQPRAARDFFTRYQDRILFGKDAYEPSEYPYYWRVFETGDEYFDYYRGYHAFWKLYGLQLPDQVLKKVYHANALRVAPGLPQDGW